MLSSKKSVSVITKQRRSSQLQNTFTGFALFHSFFIEVFDFSILYFSSTISAIQSIFYIPNQ